MLQTILRRMGSMSMIHLMSILMQWWNGRLWV